MQYARLFFVPFLITALIGMGFNVPSVEGQSIPAVCDDNVAGKTEEQLRRDLELCNAEIAQWQGVLNGTKQKVTTIDTDIKGLTAKIKTAEATIKAKNIAISQLSKDIGIHSDKIDHLESVIDEGRDSLAQLVRKTDELDDYTLIEALLDSKNISEFFLDFDSFFSVQRNLKERFAVLREAISQNEDQKVRLAEVQNQEMDAKYEVEKNKVTIAKNEQEKKKLLAATKLEAKSYEQIVADRQAKKNEINNALFRLRGIDGGGIPFREALSYAKTASSYTGVRAAFILGILRQESNLGVNVGQCLLVDTVTGAGKGKNTGTPFSNVMKADRDVPYFLDLMERLGRDPFATPISCPQSVGYGGAMGPTQFIPSTWKGYEGRIAAAYGVATGDPWNPEHAIMATALFLQDLGAGGGGYSAEREAAGRYYAGGYWATSGLGYAASVLGHAEEYESQIDLLEDR